TAVHLPRPVRRRGRRGGAASPLSGGSGPMDLRSLGDRAGQTAAANLPMLYPDLCAWEKKGTQVIDLYGGAAENRTPDPQIRSLEPEAISAGCPDFLIKGTAAIIRNRSPTFIGQELGISPIG